MEETPRALATAAGLLVLGALGLDPRVLFVAVLIVLGLWWASEES